MKNFSSSLAAPLVGTVEHMLMDLIEGRCSRDDVAHWANQWVLADEPLVDDALVWQALVHLAGADLKVTDSTYLHGQADFQAWLDELQISGAIAHAKTLDLGA